MAQALGITAAPLRLDSQAKYAVVARGDASIYLRLPHGGYRRMSGTMRLVRSSSARRVVGSAIWMVGRCDFTNGPRLTANRGVVATAAPIHDAVLSAVRAVCG